MSLEEVYKPKSKKNILVFILIILVIIIALLLLLPKAKTPVDETEDNTVDDPENLDDFSDQEILDGIEGLINEENIYGDLLIEDENDFIETEDFFE